MLAVQEIAEVNVAQAEAIEPQLPKSGQLADLKENIIQYFSVDNTKNTNIVNT